MSGAQPIQMLGTAERKIIAKEIQRLRSILAAIEQLEQCDEDCTDARAVVNSLWAKYNKLLTQVYKESPEQAPWQEPNQNQLASAKS